MTQIAHHTGSERPPVPSVSAIVADGERVVHLAPDNCFRAHLSIYEFASAYCAGAVVLDVGSGTGYGAARVA